MKMNSKIRNELPSEAFGIPQTRSFPLNDKEHVQKAIQFFKSCPSKYKKQLALKIYKRANYFNIEISPDSELIKYLPSNIKENFDDIFQLDVDTDVWLESFILQEVMKEQEAADYVQQAIDYWNQRYKSVMDLSMKSSLLQNVKQELQFVESRRNVDDSMNILLRAKATSRKINQIGKKITGNKVTNHLTAGSQVTAVAGKTLVKGAAVAGISALAGGIAKGATKQAIQNKYGTTNKNGGEKGNARSTIAGAAAAVGAASAIGLSRAINKERTDKNELLRNQALRYYNFLTNLLEKVKSLNVSQMRSPEERRENNG